MPFKRVGSCGIIVTRSRNVSSGTRDMSMPSIRITPLSVSKRRLRAIETVDLPAPVLPTMPTLSPPLTKKLSPLITCSVVGRYRTFTFLNSTVPFSGQVSSTSACSPRWLCSWGRSSNPRSFCTFNSLVSQSDRNRLTEVMLLSKF